MLPYINGKLITDCQEMDFMTILHNPDFRENEYIEYKQEFPFQNTSKDRIESKNVEFRNDVCSFANTSDGYLIYGIKDENGIPAELNGVEINNTDTFELNLRNKLNRIEPKVPPISFHFVKLNSGKYIVILFIQHDFFAPYVHLEDEKCYRIYKRDGNQKSVVRYSELKNMFNRSMSFEQELNIFRHQRIKYYLNQEDNPKGTFSSFMLFHIIPESFANEKRNLFVIEKQTSKLFGAVFSQVSLLSRAAPCVDGLRYISEEDERQGYLYNSGVMEYFLPLHSYIRNKPHSAKKMLFHEDLWNHIDHLTHNYISIMPKYFGNQRYFSCFALLGCKDVIAEEDPFGSQLELIDRNEIISSPVVFQDINDTDITNVATKQMHIEYCFALGMRNDPSLQKLIREVYGEE